MVKNNDAERKFTHSFKTTEMGEVIKQAEALQEKVKGLQQAQGQAR